LTRRTEEFSGAGKAHSPWQNCCSSSPIFSVDDPTNHLDSIRNWLEDYSTTTHGLSCSFPRPFFLDATVDQIAEIWNSTVYFYSGNYAKYLTRRRNASNNSRAAKISATASNTRNLINRFRYQATKAKQVQSRIKELEKNRTQRTPARRKNHPLHLPRSPNPAQECVELVGASKSYGPKEVLWASICHRARRPRGISRSERAGNLP